MYWKLAIQNIRRSLRDWGTHIWHWAFHQMFLQLQMLCRCWLLEFCFGELWLLLCPRL